MLEKATTFFKDNLVGMILFAVVLGLITAYLSDPDRPRLIPPDPPATSTESNNAAQPSEVTPLHEQQPAPPPPPASENFSEAVKARTQLDEAMSSYLNGLAEVPSKAVSVEQLFNRAHKVSSILMGIADREYLIRWLSDSDIEHLNRGAPGIQIWRRESSQGVELNIPYFLGLAQQFGSDADVSFFKLCDDLHLKNFTMPDYLTALAYPPPPCTDYGSLVDLLEAYYAFSAQFPDNYANYVFEVINDATDKLLAGECACLDKASVTGALQRYLKLLPESLVAGRIARRLQGIEASEIAIRYNCARE